MNNRKLGFEKENIALKYLKSLDYEILETNWHFSNRGEIDIIAMDPNRFQEKNT